MPLEEYRRKRVFEKTPEPRPGAPGPKSTRFYVQRHHARRLHYDLRLELKGVLKSWAVPKGPTLDPDEKRLAVLVEDHPLEYGEFEGTIPAGNYGAGAVTLWDRGTYELLGDKPAEEQLERGDFKFRLHGEKLVGEFALVRIKKSAKGNEWLLLKKKDFAATPGWDAEQHPRTVSTAVVDPARLPGAVAAAMPSHISPMLAVLAQAPPEGPEWIYEVKWDGFRALCFYDHGQLRVLSRNGNRLEQLFPELAASAQAVKCETALLDGEIVVLNEQGRPSFDLMQQRTGLATATTRAQQRPATLFVFDLLYLNGYDLRNVALSERKQLLKAIVTSSAVLRYSEPFTGSSAKLLAAAQEHGLEGIVAKRASSVYQSRRSDDWRKVKIVQEQEFVICGYTAGERDHFGSLVLGVYEGERLRYVGNVGSGFDQERLESIRRRLEPLVVARSPFTEIPEIARPVTWVKPKLVCTVRFSSWTLDRHLRAPVFRGLRDDVDPTDVTREAAAAVSESDGAGAPRAPLLAAPQNEVALAVDGRRLKFTNLNKVFYPQEGYVKRDVINFYDAVADLLLPHLRDRPLSLKRYPNGIAGEYFFQKDAALSFPGWLRTEPIASSEGKDPTKFVVADDRSSLLFLANLGCIDQNPWMSRVGSLEHPDYILIDLDPSGCEYDRIVEAAQLVRAKLELLGLEGYPKTTGGDGMHIFIPIEPVYSYAQARSLAEIVARLLAAERPDLFTTPRAVASRERGKVYFDYMQIVEGKTISAPYVLRAYAGAPVSTPLAWDEVRKGLRPEQFHLGNVRSRFERVGDLFSPVLTKPQRLENSLHKLEELVRTAAPIRK